MVQDRAGNCSDYARVPTLLAQRLLAETYESPALPLSYSATLFVLRSTRILSRDEPDVCWSTPLTDEQDTDACVRGSNTRASKERFSIRRVTASAPKGAWPVRLSLPVTPRLADREDVAFAVAEPGRALGSDPGDVVDRAQSRQVVVLEPHTDELQ